jgi:hydroxymethylpyrimidine pyrophosphatase-like HAD family hydrolase
MAGGAMTWEALATDYDGTLAADGRVDAATLAALARARGGGLRLLLVTGRELESLAATFPALEAFDHIVAENGALLYEPATRAETILGAPPPPALLDALTRAAIPWSAGRSIVATVVPYDEPLAAIIRSLGLPWHVIPNKGAAMALPVGVTKATGLARTLAALGIAPARVAAIGDAENDLDLLATCGLGVAVQNALPSVKTAAAFVTSGARGAGVIELIDELLDGRR